MTFSYIIILVSVLGLGTWALYKIPKSIAEDRNWYPLLSDFAQSKGLVQEKVRTTPGIMEPGEKLTWQWLKRGFSRNPSMSKSLGTVLFKGKNNGFDFVMDEVSIRRSWTSIHDYYLRMGVEIPGIPSTMTIYPASKIRRIAKSLSWISTPARGKNLVYSFSSDPVSMARERNFLTEYRLEALESTQEKTGGVYIYNGKLFLICRRRGEGLDKLHSLYDNLGTLAKSLADNG